MFFSLFLVAFLAPLIVGWLISIDVMERKPKAKALPVDTERQRLYTQAMEELDEMDRLTGVLPEKPQFGSLSAKMQYEKRQAQEKKIASYKEEHRHAPMTEKGKLQFAGYVQGPSAESAIPRFNRSGKPTNPNDDGSPKYWSKADWDYWERAKDRNTVTRQYTAADIKNLTLREYEQVRKDMLAAADDRKFYGTGRPRTMSTGAK